MATAKKQVKATSSNFPNLRIHKKDRGALLISSIFTTPITDLLMAESLITTVLNKDPLVLGTGKQSRAFKSSVEIRLYIEGLVKRSSAGQKLNSEDKFKETASECSKFISEFTDSITEGQLLSIYHLELIVDSAKNALLCLIFSSLLLRQLLLGMRSKDQFFTTEKAMFHQIEALFYFSIGLVYKDVLLQKTHNARSEGGKNSAFNPYQPKIRQCVQYIRDEHYWDTTFIFPKDYADWAIEQARNGKLIKVKDPRTMKETKTFFKRYSDESLIKHMIWSLSNIDLLKSIYNPPKTVQFSQNL